MAISNSIQSLSTMFFLLVATATIITVSASAPAQSPTPSDNVQANDENFSFSNRILPFIMDPKLVKDCLHAITKAEGCATELLFSFATLNFHISKDCCDSISASGEKCFAAIFPKFPYGRLQFPPVLKAYCRSSVGPALTNAA